MPITAQDVRRWPQLDRDQLFPQFRDAVRHQFQDPAFWAGVHAVMADHAVMAAGLRGLLSQLRATARGTSDEAFWLPRLAAVRAYLASRPAADPTPLVRTELVDKPQRGSRRAVRAGPAATGVRPAARVAPVEFRAPSGAADTSQRTRSRQCGDH